jgi:hypothetical protein
LNRSSPRNCGPKPPTEEEVRREIPMALQFLEVPVSVGEEVRGEIQGAEIRAIALSGS